MVSFPVFFFFLFFCFVLFWASLLFRSYMISGCSYRISTLENCGERLQGVKNVFEKELNVAEETVRNVFKVNFRVVVLSLVYEIFQTIPIQTAQRSGHFAQSYFFNILFEFSFFFKFLVT